MARRKSSGPGEINAGSMADFAFLLLIFFLVTTTMDTDAGILRQLPPPIPIDAPEPPPVKEKNVYVVLVNKNDLLLVEGEVMTAGATTANGITFTEGTPDVISFITPGPHLCGLMVGLDLNGTMSCPKPLALAQTAVAGEYALDWTDADPVATSVSPVTTENWNAATSTVYFNYIKKPTSGFLYDRFVEEDAITASGQVATHAGAQNILQPLLWSTPGFMPSVTVSTTSATWPIGSIGMTLGSTAQWQPTNYNTKNKSVAAATWTSRTGVLVTLAVKPSFIYGLPEEIYVI